jgi:energy-coupling factor transporter ATP-binding protein EcfA2
MSSFIRRSFTGLFSSSQPENDKNKNNKRQRQSDIYEFPGSDEEEDGTRQRNGASITIEKTRKNKNKAEESIQSSPVVKRVKRETGTKSSPGNVNGLSKGQNHQRLAKPVRKEAKEPVEERETSEDSEDDDEDIRRSSRARKPTAKILEDLSQQTPTKLEKPTKIRSEGKTVSHSVGRSEKRSVGRPRLIVQDERASDDEEPSTPSRRKEKRPVKGTPSKLQREQRLADPPRRGRPPKKPAGEDAEKEEQTPRKKGVKGINGTPKTPRSTRKDAFDDIMNLDVNTPSKSTAKSKRAAKELLDQDIQVEDDLIVETETSQPKFIPVPKPAKNLKPVKWAAEYPDVYKTLVHISLEKLTQRRPPPVIHLDEESSKVHNLIEATVTAGEGNSMLIIGARGSGKTTLVNHVLSELGKTHKQYFHVVRLNGFIQTDDKLALREIWRQLGREMEIDEEGGKSYSDTLTMLLALLSHPDEIAGERLGEVATSVVFIMDEFDLFATHARQTLLYNLLDIAQSRKAPIAVLGLTTKYDVTESLEKRVKSRFSHRYVYLPMAKNLLAFQEICMASMLLTPEELTFEEKSTIFSSKHGSKRPDFVADWNDAVKALFSDSEFIDTFVLPTYHLTKSIPTVLTTLLLPVASLVEDPPKDSLLPIEHFLSNAKPSLAPPSSSLPLILPSLSDLQLSLLIAAARLDIIHDSDTCSFGMAYAEYVDLASKARLNHTAAGALATGAGTRVWGKEVARGEWEMLIKLGLLVLVSETGGMAGMAMGGLVKVDVKLEEIPGSVPGLSSTFERWCKQI